MLARAAAWRQLRVHLLLTRLAHTLRAANVTFAPHPKLPRSGYTVRRPIILLGRYKEATGLDLGGQVCSELQGSCLKCTSALHNGQLLVAAGKVQASCSCGSLIICVLQLPARVLC